MLWFAQGSAGYRKHFPPPPSPSRSSAANELDASLILIEPEISAKKEVLGIGPLNGVMRRAAMSSGQIVEVMGRTSRYHILQLGDLHLYRSQEHRGQYYCYKNLFRVES